jgi:ABC-type transport system involved in multi-copper enzyme maturation permease subunit
MMYALLKKDFRTFRLPMLATLLLAALTYLVGFLLTFAPARNDEPWNNRWIAAYTGCAAVGMVITIVMSIAFAGTGIASERTDRTLDFLTMLPPKRWQVLLSKLAVGTPFLALCFAIHFSILLIGFYMGSRRIPSWGNFDVEFQHLMLLVAVWGSGTLLATSVAWMFSTLLRSSVLCTGIAIAVLVIAAATVGYLSDANRWSDNFSAIIWCSLSLPIAVAAFASAWFIFESRVQP